MNSRDVGEYIADKIPYDSFSKFNRNQNTMTRYCRRA